MLRERLLKVEERIQNAVNRAGRKRDEVTLIAVTKKFPAEITREAYELGLRCFGENYVQEFERKHPSLTDLAGAEFHLIGHLQSNKSRIAAELFQVIETVDSEKLAKRLDQIVVPARPLPDGRGSIGSLEPSASASGQPLEVMIEVKLSHEESKEGAPPDSLPALIAAIRACPNLSLTGLMTMPPWCDDPEVTRPYFRELASLARLHGLTKLSMGMSHDLEAAIEEGSTHVRVGTALFGPRKKD